MASSHHIRQWQALSDAVRSADWRAVQTLAERLQRELQEIARAQSTPGPPGEIARTYRRDGLFAIGWQRVMKAPPATRAAVEHYNATLRRIPGGIGPQPKRR